MVATVTRRLGRRFVGDVHGRFGVFDVTELPDLGTYTISLNPSGAASGAATVTLYDVPDDAPASVLVGAPSVSRRLRFLGRTLR